MGISSYREIEMANEISTQRQNWQTEPPARSVNPAVSAFSMGGNIAAAATAIVQVEQLREDVKTANLYYDQNSKDFFFWDHGTYGTTVDSDGNLLPDAIQPVAPPGTFQGYRRYLGDALAEARARPFYSRDTFQPRYGALDYIASTGRGQSKASFHLDREWLNSRRKIGRYNVGQGRRIDYKYSIAKLNSELEGWNLGFRFEDNRKMMYDEQRHAHQVEILNIGIGIGNIARSGLASSVQALSEARSQKAGQFGVLSNGFAQFAGQEQFTHDVRAMGKERRDQKSAEKAHDTELMSMDPGNIQSTGSGIQSKNDYGR
jgi:hypothetical protein